MPSEQEWRDLQREAERKYPNNAQQRDAYIYTKWRRMGGYARRHSVTHPPVTGNQTSRGGNVPQTQQERSEESRLRKGRKLIAIQSNGTQLQDRERWEVLDVFEDKERDPQSDAYSKERISEHPTEREAWYVAERRAQQKGVQHMHFFGDEPRPEPGSQN